MCKNRCVSNLEMVEVLKNPWATLDDICILAGCAKSKAIEIKRECEHEAYKKGKVSHNTRYVAMETLISVLNINEKRIIKYAQIEKDLELNKMATADDSDHK